MYKTIIVLYLLESVLSVRSFKAFNLILIIDIVYITFFSNIIYTITVEFVWLNTLISGTAGVN